MAATLPSHQALDQLLRSLQLGVDPSELHGALCGFLCAGGEASEHGWLEQLALQADRSSHEVALLVDLFRVSAAQLQDPQYGFELLLPAEDGPLRDIGRIAEAAPSCDDPESDEESLAEIVEFLRVASMLLMSDRPEHPGGSRSVH